MPKRLQRRRTKGWRAPPDAVYVGRPTKWGNPYTVGIEPCGCRAVGECYHNLFRCETAQEAVDAFRWWFLSSPSRKALAELRGKDLLCWCPPGAPCHADVLLKLANRA